MVRPDDEIFTALGVAGMLYYDHRGTFDNNNNNNSQRGKSLPTSKVQKQVVNRRHT